MIKIFRVGCICGYPEKVNLAKDVNLYIHTLQCDGWEILDIDQFTGLPLDYQDRREYVEYKITCSRPDTDIDYNTFLRRRNYEI